VTESPTIIAGWQSPRLQQIRISPKVAAIDAETKEKKKKLLTFRRPQVSRDIHKDTLSSTASS